MPDVRLPRRSLLDLDPALASGLDDGQLQEARRLLPVRVAAAPVGPWDPGTLPGHPPLFGLLVVEGMLVRSCVLGGRSSGQVCGPGDLLPPGAPDVPGALCEVVLPLEVALLDDVVLAALRRWPRLAARLVGRATAWADHGLLHQGVAHLARVEHRIAWLFAELAERWGDPGADGVLVRMPLTHRAVGRLTGAERPTVSLALKRLGDRGTVVRTRDGWLVDPGLRADRLVAAAGRDELSTLA